MTARTSLAAAWCSRAQGEARVGRTFAALARSFPSGEVPGFVAAALTDASAEEAAHAALCFEMANHYALAAIVPAEERDEPLPLANPEGRSLLLLSACCISESIATAYLEHCLRRASEPRVREALRELLRDEVGHAQLGWAYAATLPPRLRADVERSLPGLIGRTEQLWRARVIALHGAGDAAHGYPPVEESLRVVGEAVDALVRPGFAHVGLRA